MVADEINTDAKPRRQIQGGDIVRLRTGSPDMTVTSRGGLGNNSIQVAWFSEGHSGPMLTAQIAEVALVLVTPIEG